MKIWHYCSLTEWKVDFSQFQNISWSFYFFEERPVVRCIRSQLPQCHVDSREGLGQLDQLLANLKNKKGGKRGDDVSECRRCTWSLTRHSSFSYRITKDLQPTWKQWRFLWWWRKSIKKTAILEYFWGSLVNFRFSYFWGSLVNSMSSYFWGSLVKFRFSYFWGSLVNSIGEAFLRIPCQF